MTQTARINPPTLPHSLEAERSVLGGVLLDNEVLADVGGSLQERDFYRKAHSRIWKAMLDLYSENKPVDLVTVTEKLTEKNQLEDVGGFEYLASLDASVPTAAHAETYARIVRERAMVRRLVQAAERIYTQGTTSPGDVGEFIEQAENSVFQIAQEQDNRELRHVKGVTLDVFGILEERSKQESDLTGIPTGYVQLDRMTAGLQRRDLIIVAARPSMGKTALALNIAANAAKKGTGAKVAIFSMEMSTEALVMRMLSSEARIPSDELRTGKVRNPSKLADSAERLSQTAIYIDDTPAIGLNQIRSKCRRMKAKVGLDLIIVDYLQLMSGPKSDNREQEIASISRGMKALAMDLNAPVIALSQLNRALERRENKRPQLADLRESGAIEQDADIIMFIHREERYRQQEDASVDDTGLAEIIVAKQRNGPTGTAKLVFFEEFTRFDNYATDP